MLASSTVPQREASADARPSPDAEPRVLELFPVPIVVWRWHEAAATKGALMNAVDKRRAAGPGIERTNVNGWHSHADLPAWPEQEVQALVRWIAQCARNTSRRLNGDSWDVPHWRLEGWANVNPAGGHNWLHHHAQRNWHWSACYYLNLGVIESEDTPGGAIVFEEWGMGLQPAAMKSAGRRVWRHRPSEGQLILFPAWLDHAVEPHYTSEPRMSFAFNLHGVGLERCRMWQYQPPIPWRLFPRFMRRMSALVGGADLSRHALPSGYDFET